jgi:hypothetical protein
MSLPDELAPDEKSSSGHGNTTPVLSKACWHCPQRSQPWAILSWSDTTL